MYGDVVMEVPHAEFEKILSRHRKKRRAKSDSGLKLEALREVVKEYKQLIRKHAKRAFPTDPRKQLMGAIEAVLASWNNERARVYRSLNDIPEDAGTACTVQAMVFGNRGQNSGTGVGFTRNPATGEPEFYGEFLLDAQGEDVVAGIRTPRPLRELRDALPDVYGELEEITTRLERHYGDMQDFEFTIEDGRLYMLQTRTGKRTGIAATRIAIDMVDEGLITREEAVIRVEPVQLLQLLHPVFDPVARKQHEVVARGLNASPGAACGRAVFSADEAVARAGRGEAVVLLRHETSPDDIHGMASAVGMLTAAGGMTSHAAVVGRQMGKPAVVGCHELRIHRGGKSGTIGKHPVAEGDWISIDGTTGDVILAEVPTTPSEVIQVVTGKLAAEKSAVFQSFNRLLEWADLIRRLRVRANADNGRDGRIATAFGAEGIGLCRTEHMFFGEDRVEKMRAMILARTPTERKKALRRLLPMQRKDFIELFRAMEGLPVTVRTLDPPLHEFLPNPTELQVEIEVMKATGKTRGRNKTRLAELESLLERVEELSEFNPMLGWRGCRLTIIVPEIIEMQARAVMEAAAKCIADGIDVRPEIMVPLVGHVEELRRQREVIERTADAVMTEKRVRIPYSIGTMIEVPRGALTADEIAEVADFFSFGTNDLTQTTFGFSRDDAGTFLGEYVERGILPRNPFVSIDRGGVGKLMEIAVEGGRRTHQRLKIGICGEHGGDPQSVGFCHDIGLDYVSCSPYRIPVARLAAAQAELHQRGVEEIIARARRTRRAKLPPTYHGAVPG
jgi:pyruvate,orthophosphate dikinase